MAFCRVVNRSQWCALVSVAVFWDQMCPLVCVRVMGVMSFSWTQGREMTMMDVCCGLGTVSLAGRALTEAVRSAAPDDRRGFKVS